MEMTSLDTIIQAAQSGEWVVFAGAVLMLLVWVVRTFVKDRLPANIVPYVVAVLGVATYIGGGLISEEVAWYTALYNGLLASGEATILWSTIGKHLLPKTKPAVEAVEE